MPNLLKLLFRKPAFMEHRPAPEPRRRASRPAVTHTVTQRTVHFSLVNIWRDHSHPAARSNARRALGDLPLFNALFGPRQPRPPSVARVRAANRRRDAAAARISARQAVPRQPAPASRPATREDMKELRRLQRERAKTEAARAKAEAARQGAATVVEAEVVSDTPADADKPVPVRRHKREGHVVRAHHREKPGEGDAT